MGEKRLTDNNKELIKCVGYTCEEVCHQHPCTCTDCPIEQGIIKLAEYEDLEEQGLLLRLPCKIGSIVYKIITQHDNYDDSEYKIVTAVDFRLEMSKQINKTVFLTQSEAEEKLRELEGK